MYHTFIHVFVHDIIFAFFIFILGVQVSVLYIHNCSQTLYVAKGPPVSTSYMLELDVCNTMPGLFGD